MQKYNKQSVITHHIRSKKAEVSNRQKKTT